MMTDLAWLICAFPLAGAILLALLGRRMREPWAGLVATTAMAGSFASSASVFIGLLGRDGGERRIVTTLFEWIAVGDFSVDAGLLADPLSVTMALFVTGVGALIHLYAIGYMHGEADFTKFFCYLNLFAFSMLVLVLGDNLALTFLGWEGVGACSYLLISFWFTDEANSSAGKKAFITNRVGDWGFMLAMFLTFSALGSIGYTDVLDSAGSLAPATATAITLLLFVGAAGKSAQIPLCIWLPDAMAGPTPVSALIHAATMVTAGVYLLVRVNPVIAAADGAAADAVAWVGVATTLLAASVAAAQNDIKKVLAYSTVSQLGYMMLAVGVGAYTAAVFHMVTHAFFKALLFLGAGSVIHAMHEEQDIRRYGGLRKPMPVTAAVFAVGWLAISGVPPLSGFWSKDEILLFAWSSSPALWAAGMAAAVLTAFYMSRLVFLTFFGSPRYSAVDSAPAEDSDESVGAHGSSPTAPARGHSPPSPHRHEPAGHRREPSEPPAVMLAPMAVLAAAAAAAGGLNLPFSSDLHFLGHWLEPSLFGNEAHTEVGAVAKWLLASMAAVGGLGGIAAAAAVYLRGRLPERMLEWPLAARAYRLDEAVTRLAGGPGRRVFDSVAAFDSAVVDGAVNGTGRAVRAAALAARRLQTGFVRFYALLTAMGVVGLFAWFLSRATL